MRRTDFGLGESGEDEKASERPGAPGKRLLKIEISNLKSGPGETPRGASEDGGLPPIGPALVLPWTIAPPC